MFKSQKAKPFGKFQQYEEAKCAMYNLTTLDPFQFVEGNTTSSPDVCLSFNSFSFSFETTSFSKGEKFILLRFPQWQATLTDYTWVLSNSDKDTQRGIMFE